MEKESQRRRSKIAKKRKRNRSSSAAQTSMNDLTDDLLQLVLLGLHSPVCLVRAASTCKRWCHVVADAGFLRRFRSIHPAQPLGHFYNVNNELPGQLGWIHEWPEEPSVYVPTPAGRTDLSLDFVPYVGGPPEVVDSRGSLILLLKEKSGTQRGYPSCGCCDHIADYIVPDLVVCEPSTRRYYKIDPPNGRVCILNAFLLDDEAIQMTNFRVLLVQYEHDRDFGGDRYNGHGFVSADVFSSNGSGWCYGDVDYTDGMYLPHLLDIDFAGRTGGRIYWGCCDGQVMVFDEHSLKFSTMALPDHMKWSIDEKNFRFVAGEGGTARIVIVTEGGDI